MVLSGESIKLLNILFPCEPSGKQNGMSYGLGPAGYDIRISGDYEIAPGKFELASTIEHFKIPRHIVGIVHDKSTWARQGLAVQNTVLEPGWMGYLTLELSNHSDNRLYIKNGDPIAQVIFHKIDQPVDGYNGKYQNQEAGPQQARFDF